MSAVVILHCINQKEQQMDNRVVKVFHIEEDNVKIAIGNTIMRNFTARNKPPLSIPPSHTMEIFFRTLPAAGVIFSRPNGRPLRREEIAHLEKVVSDTLFETYKSFTQYPSPRDVITDILSELKSCNIMVSVPYDWV